MRRRKPLIIFILLLIAIIVFLLQFNVTPKNINSPYTAQKPQTENTKEEKQNILDMQKQIEEKVRKEQEAKAEQERLQRLQNPEIITSQLREVGTLITYQGEVTYKDIIIQKGFLNKRELNVNINYEFGIGIDLNKIKIGQIVKDTVTIIIPKEAMKVKYLKILPKNTTLIGQKSTFAKQFKPEDIEFVYETAQSTSLNRINNTPELFEKAYSSLENKLKKLAIDLGYKKVRFEEMTNKN